MPLLRKQPFHKVRPPTDLRPDEEVFYCKITSEIFRDYEAFFERIILCNSLVWSCAITGRSGMTYQEAEECEEKARRHLATFQDNLQRPLLFMATMTHRSRLADLNDDVFLFAKDRYFIGETVDVLIAGERRPSKIVKVVAPADSSSKTNGDVIVIDEDSESEGDEKRELPPAEKMMYIVHPSTGKNNRVMVKASQVSRKKGLYTRDKSKLFLKQHCEAVKGVWSVKASVMQKMHLTEAKYEDFYGGPRPKFQASIIKKKNLGKKPLEAVPTPTASTSTPKTTSGKSANSTPTVSSKNSSPSESVPSPQSQLTPAERAARKEQERLEKVAERIAKQQEIKQKLEEEKQRRKEEREKEREKKREEKKKQMEKLKEWSRPRDDLECDDLKPFPELKEVQTRVPTHLFGDAVMVLEYLNAFKSVFDFKQFFPKGFTWREMEMGLMETDPQGPLCDLLQMLLCALFNLQEEEAEEYQALEKEQTEELEKKPSGDEEQNEEDDHVSNNELIRSASLFAQVSQLTFGMPLKDTLLDQFTLTEVLRLHLLSSGARANSKNARFRYQQRGGYSSLDDPGLELRKQDPLLLKKLQSGNVFDFSPDDKLRLVTTLVQQVMTYAAVRDIVEETYDKLRVKKYDLKLLQWAEVRRIKEDQAIQYKRQVEEKMKEREYRLKELARAEQIKQAKEQGLEPPELPPLEDPLESPEQRQQREEKEKQEEAKKRADYARRELEALQVIVELQRTNALYPMGRDRHYRRYWLFSSLPAVMVEDNELFLCAAAGPAVCGDDQEMPELTRQEDHNTSSDKENELNRTPGPDVQVNGAKGGDPVSDEGEDAESRQKETLVPCGAGSDDKAVSETQEKDTSVCKDTVKEILSSEKDTDTDQLSSEQDQSSSVSRNKKVSELDDEIASIEATKLECAEVERHSPDLELPRLDSSPLEHLLQQQQPKWYVLHSRECLQNLMATLNMRGFRESALHAVLQDFSPLLGQTIDSCPLDTLCPTPKDKAAEAPRPQIQTRASAPSRVEGSTQSDSASEAIELTLRDALLELEERIFVGSLGVIKVKDRAQWRAALENGGYSPQTEQLPFALQQSPKKEKKEKGVVHVPEEQVARDLAHALVQIARGVEPRFMRQPLDASDKEPRRRVYDRWDESLLGSSSLSQVYLHLASLDKSISWDRSALMARCRICRRKADPEKMLLCDKCDRGHHMYCLTPPMTKVPSGDWFCPNCRPKVPPPSPRKSRRRTFSEVEEEEDEEEERLELQDTIEEEASEEEEDMEQQSDDEVEAREEEEEEEEEDESDEEEEEENEDVCAACREDGKLILCDVCPRSYHLHCARPVLKKVPKGKWMCQVCVDGGRAGKIQFGRPRAGSSKAQKTSQPRKRCPKHQAVREAGPANPAVAQGPGERPRATVPPPPPPAVSAKSTKPGHEITPKGWGQRSREVTPKQRGQVDKDWTPKSGEKATKTKRGSVSRLSNDGEFEISARQYTSSKRGNSQVQQMRAAEDLLQELIRHNDAWPFLSPVDKKLVPDYYDVIQNPMDLSTIRNRVHRFHYTDPVQLLDDVRLIFTNCVEYNARNTPEYRAGQNLNKFFDSRVRDLALGADSSSAPPPAKKQRR
ncbi:LOW QUALITY PROTEIN: bromodomain adjacent to zinc finger domain protein 1A-like [Babylonia areolata]|uniref:LOW QUALITY PROTEIN: bromodomain adjacent to zinc finger domain protein 1A-like n=1 Tax=Babylonia areolata TaxID=304850 RepID=UPI003FD1BD9F